MAHVAALRYRGIDSRISVSVAALPKMRMAGLLGDLVIAMLEVRVTRMLPLTAGWPSRSIILMPKSVTLRTERFKIPETTTTDVCSWGGGKQSDFAKKVYARSAFHTSAAQQVVRVLENSDLKLQPPVVEWPSKRHRWTNMYIATCPLSPADDCGLPVRCSINETVVYQNTVYLQSRCGPPCHEFVMVSSLVDPDFDYSVTGPLLSELYWRRRHQSKLGNSTASSELQFPITTVVHLSKGDATKANSSTGTTGLLENEQVDFNPIITALVDLVDPQCLKVELHTSAQLNSTFVQGVVTSWKNNNVNEVEVFDNSCQESEAFDRMASADILIGDASGFSRLAGVLGKASVSIFVDPELGDTRGVGGVFTHGKSGQAAVEPDLANISKVIDGCNAWLGK